MESNIKAPWVTWWQNDLPCRFSPQRAIENSKYLLEVIGSDWVTRSTSFPGATNHPLLQRWLNNGAGSFIELNSLAEDLRLLQSVPGLQTVIEDLRDAARCLPTWHVIHSAALFERSEKGIVAKFFPQTDMTAPDFLLKNSSGEIPVEAKLLVESKINEDFQRYAEELSSAIKSEVMKDNAAYPVLYVICKNAESLPDIPNVVQVAKVGLQQFSGNTLAIRHRLFNLSWETPMQNTSSISEYRACFIYCPKSEKEDLRVEGRSKDASKQLAAHSSLEKDGILCLGFNEYQDPHYVKALLEKRFAVGRFSGIARAIFMRTGTHLGPPERSLVNLLGVVHNSNKPPSDRFDLRILGVGLMCNLFQAVAPEQGIPAYRFGVVEAQLTPEQVGQGIVAPDIRILTAEMVS